MRILILGGTTEASDLARRLAGDARFEPVLSLAGVTRAPKLPPIPHRIGGFGGVDGLVRYLRAHAVQALVDATHPFAQQISAHAAAAVAQTGTPLLRIERPAWRPGPGDRWTTVPDMAAAARALGFAPRRVLLTIGRKDLAPFAAAPWHHYVVRSVDPPPAETLPASARIITATGPFAEPAERALLRDHGIEILVTKNAGGSATAAKLDAARALGLPVILAARPPPIPAIHTVPDAPAARDWLLRAHAAERGV